MKLSNIVIRDYVPDFYMTKTTLTKSQALTMLFPSPNFENYCLIKAMCLCFTVTVSTLSHSPRQWLLWLTIELWLHNIAMYTNFNRNMSINVLLSIFRSLTQASRAIYILRMNNFPSVCHMKWMGNLETLCLFAFIYSIQRLQHYFDIYYFVSRGCDLASRNFIFKIAKFLKEMASIFAWRRKTKHE